MSQTSPLASPRSIPAGVNAPATFASATTRLVVATHLPPPVMSVASSQSGQQQKDPKSPVRNKPPLAPPGMKAVSIGGEGAAGTWPLGAFCQRAQVPPAFRNQPPTTTRTQPPTAPLRQSLPGASWGPEVTFQWPVQPKLRANPAKGRQLLVALALSTKPSRPQISKHPAGKPSPRSPFLLSRSSLSAARVFPSLRRHLHFDFVSLHLPDCAS